MTIQNKINQLYQEKHHAIELVLLLVLIGVAGRLAPHLPNFTPVGALAVWGGMRLAPGKSIAFVLVTMLISDMFLGFHDTVLYVYGSLLVTTLLASKLKTGIPQVTGMTLAGAILFFLVTNFGTWAHGTMYPHSLAGLMQSYANAIPFFRASLLGDAFYTVVLFGAEFVILTALAKQAIMKKVNS